MPDGFAGDQTVHQEYDWTEIRPTVAIIETIERYEHTAGRSAAGGLDRPLGHYLDTEALNQVVQDAPAAYISLNLDDYTVTITNNTVQVTVGSPPPTLPQ